MSNKKPLQLIAIILCLALALGAIIFFSTSGILTPVETASNTTKSVAKKISTEKNISPLQSELKQESIPEETPSEASAKESDAKELNEVPTETKLITTINQHANQTAKNDLLRQQAEKLEQEIQRKLQSLEQDKTQ